jgi:hypothetical protein
MPLDHGCRFDQHHRVDDLRPIDSETRDVIQTVYIRRVEKRDGQLINVEFDKIDNVKDPFKARMKN